MVPLSFCDQSRYFVCQEEITKTGPRSELSYREPYSNYQDTLSFLRINSVIVLDLNIDELL